MLLTLRKLQHHTLQTKQAQVRANLHAIPPTSGLDVLKGLFTMTLARVTRGKPAFLVRTTSFLLMWYVSLSIWYSMSSRMTEYLRAISRHHRHYKTNVLKWRAHSILSAVESCIECLRFKWVASWLTQKSNKSLSCKTRVFRTEYDSQYNAGKMFFRGL